MKLAVAAILFTITFGVPAFAEPATQPASPDIPKLIKQLGDEDFQKREAATDALRKIGRDAIPALKEAQVSPNPEVQTRADSLIKEIEEPPQPQSSGRMNNGIVVFPGGNMRMQVQMQMNGQHNGNRNLTAVENGRKVSISENGDGIKMTITEPDKDGKDVEHTYEAKNAEELKKVAPDAWVTYDKYMGQNAGNIADFRFGIDNMRLDIGADIQKRLADIDKQMAQHMQQLKQFQGQQFGRLRLHGFDLNAGQDIESLGGNVEEADGALKAQLGAGVIVRSVDAGSRAEKLGLQVNDLIQKVNDKPVKTPDELEKALDGIDHLKLEVLRAGKSTTLEEK